VSEPRPLDTLTTRRTLLSEAVAQEIEVFPLRQFLGFMFHIIAQTNDAVEKLFV